MLASDGALIVQVRPNYRTAVTIPERFWGRFRDIMSDFIDHSSTPPAVSDKPTEDTVEVKEEEAADTAAATATASADGN